MKKDKLIKRQIKRLNKKVGKTTTIIRGGGGGSTGSSDFLGLSDTPDSYSGQGSKYVRVNSGATALEFVTLAGGGDLLSTNNLSDLTNASTARTNLGLATTANQTDSTDKRFMTDAQEAKLDAILGTNTGDQTSIVGITGTKAQFDTAVTDGNFMYVGDAPTTHSHAISDVTGLQTALDGKQPIDTQLTDLASLSYGSNALKVVRVNAGETSFELATLAGGGDVVGDDTSTTAQNIVAYSGTGGKNITELTGTQGDILYHNGTSWQKLAAGTVGQYLETNGTGANPSWQFGAVIHYSISSGATTTGANTTPVNVSGAVFNYVANAVYRIWVMGRLNSSVATTGAAIHFDLSSAVTAIDVNFFHQLAAGTTGTLTGGHSIADDTSAGTSSGVPAGPLDVPITGFGLLVTGANTGTCQLRLRAEVAAVTELLAGTVMVVERVG